MGYRTDITTINIGKDNKIRLKEFLVNTSRARNGMKREITNGSISSNNQDIIKFVKDYLGYKYASDCFRDLIERFIQIYDCLELDLKFDSYSEIVKFLALYSILNPKFMKKPKIKKITKIEYRCKKCNRKIGNICYVISNIQNTNNGTIFCSLTCKRAFLKKY